MNQEYFFIEFGVGSEFSVILASDDVVVPFTSSVEQQSPEAGHGS